MEPTEARDYCDRWLAAWNGGDPAQLLAWYAPEAHYRDPGVPQGLQGHDQLGPYFAKLMAAFSGWRWEALEVIPTTAGFTLKWRAYLPAGAQVIVEEGLDIVDLDGSGRISRNEVYFDRTAWLQALGTRG